MWVRCGRKKKQPPSNSDYTGIGRGLFPCLFSFSCGSRCSRLAVNASATSLIGHSATSLRLYSASGRSLLFPVWDCGCSVVDLLSLDDGRDVLIDVPDIVVNSLDCVDVMWRLNHDIDVAVSPIESRKIPE